jgi:RNA polymerase sigma factor (TIGR02999 family)
MRQILVDHARRTASEKRGGDWRQVSLADADQPTTADPLDALALDDALARLAQLDPRQHRIVELRFFAGLTMEEIAEVLGYSKATVELDWRAARAWLNLQLN